MVVARLAFENDWWVGVLDPSSVLPWVIDCRDSGLRSHGSSAMAQVQARLTLFQEVAQLANEIEATYPNTVYHMVRSAEEIRFDEQQRRRLECQEKAMKVIEANCTNLRMKKVRDIYDSSLNGIDAGEYVHTLRGGKKFKLEVYTGPTAARAELTRLS